MKKITQVKPSVLVLVLLSVIAMLCCSCNATDSDYIVTAPKVSDTEPSDQGASEIEYDPNEPMTWYAEAQNGGIEDDAIDKIKDGMTLDEVISILGRPQRDVGYGMMIMEWDMKPGKVFTVWFTPEPYPTPCEPNGIYHGNSLDWVTSDMEVLDKSGD